MHLDLLSPSSVALKGEPMTETKMTLIKHRNPGNGNRVVVALENPCQSSLDTSIDNYLEQYHPNGYMTYVVSRYSCPTGERAIISRLASCD